MRKIGLDEVPEAGYGVLQAVLDKSRAVELAVLRDARPQPRRERQLADARVPHHREKGVDAEEEVGRLRSLDVDQREDESPLDVCAYEALKSAISRMQSVL